MRSRVDGSTPRASRERCAAGAWRTPPSRRPPADAARARLAHADAVWRRRATHDQVIEHRITLPEQSARRPRAGGRFIQLLLIGAAVIVECAFSAYDQAVRLPGSRPVRILRHLAERFADIRIIADWQGAQAFPQAKTSARGLSCAVERLSWRRSVWLKVAAGRQTRRHSLSKCVPAIHIIESWLSQLSEIHRLKNRFSSVVSNGPSR
jgi:hypothetical protein